MPELDTTSNPDQWHILVVEDEPDGQEVALELLKTHNIRTDIAATAEEALDLLKLQSYTAAIIDLALPQMDGLELLRAIRSNPAIQGMPCIAYTAYHSSLVKKQAIEAGCNAYLTKPVDDQRFVIELSRIITTPSV
jgi:CheY-like chemotaxis protein